PAANAAATPAAAPATSRSSRSDRATSDDASPTSRAPWSGCPHSTPRRAPSCQSERSGDRSLLGYSVGIPYPDQIFPSGVMIHREHIARVDELVLKFVGEIDALERQFDVRIERVLNRGVDVERAIRALHVVARF